MKIPDLDIKKIAIIGGTIITGLLIFLFFLKTEEKPVPHKGETLLIPNSEAEATPGSKTEMYATSLAEKQKRFQESQESTISSSAFFDLVSSEEENNKTSSPESISAQEKQERLNSLFKEKPAKSSSHWTTSEVEDKLGDFEEKKPQANNGTPASSRKHLPEKPERAEEESIPSETSSAAIPGRRSRNNSLSAAHSIQDGNLIPAVIHSDQTITNGATVKIRLLEDLYVENQKIPRNTFIYGIARFGTERIDIQLSSIRLGKNIIPFQKMIFDKDGLKGLYFPDNVGNQMSKEVSGDAIDQAYDIATSNTGVIGDVLSAGKSVLKRKQSERKVTLKANYNIYLQ